MRKLRRADGATMIMALFAFLIATIVSTVMISAAMTAMKAAKRQQTYEQAYLVVQSTEDIISDMVSEIKYDSENGEFACDTVGSKSEYLCEAINKLHTGSGVETLQLTFSSGANSGADVDALISRTDEMNISISVEEAYSSGNKWMYDMTIKAVDRNTTYTDKTYASEKFRVTGEYKDGGTTWTSMVRRK